MLNLLLIFVVELSVGDDRTPLDWNIPQYLEPLESNQIKKSKLIYDLIDFGLMNKAQNHFIVYYQDRSITGVITYDGIQNHERAVQVSNLHLSIHLSGISCYLLVIFDTMLSIDFVEEEELKAAFIDNILRSVKRSWESYSQPEILYLCLKFYIREI